ncbi:beta/gamma crystallin domain-containing protein [Streptomyces sp. NPDC004682]
MHSAKMRSKVGGAAAFVGAVIMTLLGPVTNASAGELPCDGHTDYLKIVVHGAASDNWNGTRCFAGPKTAGRVEGWLDEISTGNNVVQIEDINGTYTDFAKWTWTVFPNRPPHIHYVYIY